MNFYEHRRSKTILVGLLIVCMFLTSGFLEPQSAAVASFNPGANGTQHVKQETPSLIITAPATASGTGDGFLGNYKYLTEKQMDGISDEATADVYFASQERDTWLADVVYSARTKESKGGWGQYAISGLDLRAVAESMGFSAQQDCSVFMKGTDGHTSTLANAFKERYTFPSETAAQGSGTAVSPAIALEGKQMAGDLPRLVFGQESSGDFNMQDWEKWLKCVWLGKKETVLTVTLNGQQKNYTLADLIGTKSGIYQSTYQYTDGGSQETATATGIPLDKLLADAGMSGTNIIKTADGKTISSPSRYFLAYDAELDSGTFHTSGQLVLFGPGTTKGEVVKENIKGISVSVKAPAAAKGLKATKKSYNRIGLSWGKVSGAHGYNIYRYNSSSKKYQLLDCTEGATRTSYTDSSLKTGTKYSYRVKAYITVGSIDVEGAFSNTASATPALAKTTAKLSRYGKQGIRIKWKKVDGANGYQVRLGTNKKTTKGKKTYTIKRGSTLKKNVKNLKKGKRYYVKVRPYRNIGGKKVYGAYSSVKSIKVKKGR